MVNISFEYVGPLFGILMIFLNLMEIIMILRMTERPFSIVYLLNLSICDLFTGFIVIFVRALSLSMMNSKELIFLYELAVFSMLRLSLIMSSLSLFVITIDRYIGVILPFYYRRIQRRHAKYVCLCLWLLATVLIVIEKIIMTYIPRRNHLYLDLIFPILIFPTSFIIGYGYSSIVQKLRQTRKDLQRSSSSNSFPSVFVIQGRRLKEFKQEERLTGLLVANIVVYIVCWFPIAIQVICVLSVRREIAEKYFGYSFDICICIALFNACLNPIIYFHHIRRNMSGLVNRVKRKVSSAVWKQSTVREDLSVNEISEPKMNKKGLEELSVQLSTKL